MLLPLLPLLPPRPQRRLPKPPGLGCHTTARAKDPARPPQEAVPDELFDEASGRWFELPHPMAEPRNEAHVVSLPAAALAPPTAAAAAANA